MDCSVFCTPDSQPPVTPREVEDYAVDLSGVTAVELHIVPDISGSGSRASLSEWILA